MGSQKCTRIAVVTVGILCNIGLCLFGVVATPKDYDTYLLGQFVLNLVIYFTYYVLMKVTSFTSVLHESLVYVIYYVVMKVTFLLRSFLYTSPTSFPQRTVVESLGLG